MRKKLFCCIFLSVAFLSSYAQLSTEQRDSILLLKIGTPFPNVKLPNTNGNTFSEQDLKGKITVINFWFESCVPCIKELDALNKLFLTFKDNPDFRFISFTTDSLETAKEAIEKFGILFDVYPTTKKECKHLFCTEFPTNLIVDQQGNVAYIKAGIYPNDTHILQMKLLTAFLLMEKNWKSPHSYTVSASVLPDSLSPAKPLTIEDLYRKGLLKKEDKDQEPVVGRKYLDFNATTIYGKNISYEQLQGKITMIDIWEEGCAPCVAEFEFLNKLYLHYKNSTDFQLFTFTNGREEDVKEIVKAYNLMYDVACIGIKECYRLNYNAGFPTIIIIDKNGAVSFYSSNGFTEKEEVAEYFEKLYNKIDDLLQ